MDILCCQTEAVWESPAASLAAARALVAPVRVPDGALLVFPEMFSTGFSMNVEAVAEGPDGAAHDFLAAEAQRYRAFAMGGVVTPGPDGLGRNQVVCYDPAGWKLMRYTKLHPFSPAGEHEHYLPGEQVVTFRVAEAVVAPLLCYDLRFPEAFRQAARRGAEVMVVPANWPAQRADQWEALLRARAIENQAVVVGVNRCGHDPQHEYAGGSMVVAPRGDVVGRLGEGPGVLHVTVDLDDLREYRRSFPVLRDIRPDLLGEHRSDIAGTDA